MSTAIKILLFLLITLEVSSVFSLSTNSTRKNNSTLEVTSVTSLSTNSSRKNNSTRKTTKRKFYSYGPKYCSVTFKDMRKNIIHDPSLPMIYFVTPTYPRPEQIPELVRLSQTLMHVPRIYWIVADDNQYCSTSVAKLLERTGLPYAHISSPKPIRTNGTWLPQEYHRGVANRRAALKFIRKFQKKGILYFGDDDNTYDLELFTEIRKTKKISMFPVGLMGLYGVASPLVKNGKVIAFFSSWNRRSKFPVDMAGFAINIKYLKNTTGIPFGAGTSANSFLKSAGFSIEDIEPLANNCSKVLVWHTQTVKYPERKLRANLLSVAHSKYENLAPLLTSLTKDGVLKTSATSGKNGSIILKGAIVDKLAYL